MKPDSSKVDLKQSLQVVRRQEIENFGENDDTGNSASKITLPVKKKPVNIPICEVTIDEDYEKSIPISFSLPPSYVKHIRKIVEDVDVGTDYVADKEDMIWIQSISKYYQAEKFSVDMFESIINFFERVNGSQRDTITQSVALRAISGKFDLSVGAIQKLLTDVYKYWVVKRDKWGKPLVRKFWPVVPATDTNPHLVFRMRDRERYRLRRHRRNDLDSFRKLQQFRREFEQAKTIAQLMLERESIAEVDFMVAREIFLEEIKELGCELAEESHFDKSNDAANFAYEPLYKHLWVPMNTTLPDVAPSDFDFILDDASDCTSLKDFKSGFDAPTTKTNKKNSKFNEDGRISALTVEEALMNEKKTTEKKKKKTDKLIFYGNDGMEVLDVAGVPSRTSALQKNLKRAMELGTNDVNYLGYSKPSILDEELPFTVSITEESGPETKLIHDDLDGPKIICRPSWPHYYEKNTQGRGRIFIDNPEDYLEALELRRDEYGEPMIPHKYRIRYRVGRGGRLVADKIPIYKSAQDHSPSDDEDEVNEDLIRYLYPTQSRPIPLVGGRDIRAFPPQMIANVASAQPVNNSFPSSRMTGGGNLSMPGSSMQGVDTMSDRPNMYDMPMTTSAVSGTATKPLPELPNSNRRVMHQVRKYGKLYTPGYAWCGSTIPPFSYLPPTVPPGPTVGYYEKIDRLQQIVTGNDSEDDEVFIDHSYGNELGEFHRLMQKHAESLVTAAHSVQALPTTQKKNQQQQQLARIKMSLDA